MDEEKKVTGELTDEELKEVAGGMDSKDAKLFFDLIRTIKTHNYRCLGCGKIYEIDDIMSPSLSYDECGNSKFVSVKMKCKRCAHVDELSLNP